MSLKDAVKINGFKFRSWKKDGYWSDPFEPYVFWSRTFLQEGTEIIEATSITDMVTEIKKGDKKFREVSLSEESKAVFKDEKIENKVEKIVMEIKK
ncbi:hypothetical protein LCGC14_1394510 [marine sediment metagenome]|uniref:Uncharacterized protein n=1 Tax=marine sediment metagenome TaxID=412755 RepID=A0A0F9JYY8_9ZZZZ